MDAKRIDGPGTSLDRPVYGVIAAAMLVITSIVAVWLATRGLWVDTIALAAFVVAGLIFAGFRKHLPEIFSLLFAVAGLVNASGYAFELWHSPPWFDETVHAYTSFAGVAAISWLLLARRSLNGAEHPGRFIAVVATIGLVLGILWEVFEWIIGIIGNRTDTIVDLVMDMIGTIMAGLFGVWAARVEQREHPGRGSTVLT